MKFIRTFSTVLARFFLSAVFLAGAVSKLFHWHESEKMLMNTLCDWQASLGFYETAQNCLAMITPWTPLLLIAATLFEMVGGLLLLLGMKEKLGASLLILFLIPATLLMHAFWLHEGGVRELQTIMFLKNLAILGGLLLVLLHGAQAKSGGDSSFSSMNLG